MPWISIPDAKRCHGGLINGTEESTNALGIANSSARLIPAGAVCLSRTASVGYVAITGRPMATSQDFVNWICGDQLLPEFLQHLFLAEGENLLRFASGAVHKTIYFPEVKAFHVCVPDMAAQRRIVAILDEAFAGIDTAKSNADKNLHNSRELYESRVESLFAAGGVSWVARPLAEVASIINGYAFQGTDFQRTPGVRSIKITNVGVREFVDDASNYLPTAFSATHVSVAVTEGSIVLALTRTIIAGGLKVALVPADFDGALLNQRVAAIQPDTDQLETAFLFAYLSTRRVADYVKSRVNTLMQPNLSITDLRLLPVPLPALSEQQALLKALQRFSGDFQKLDSIYRRKLAALDELKHSLLHQAFTGRLSPSNDRQPHRGGLQMCTQ